MTYLTPGIQPLEWLQALHSSDSAFIVTDDQLRVVHISDGLTRLLGYTLADLQGQRPLQALVQESKEFIPHIRNQLKHDGTYTGELQLTHKDGRALWVAVSINTLNRQPMPLDGMSAEVVMLTDIRFSKRFEALQRQVLEDVVQEKPLQALMHDMCQELEQLLPHTHVSVLTVDRQGLLHPLAAPSLPAGLATVIDGRAIGPDVGACGTAAYWGQEIISSDLRNDPNWAEFADAFVAAGLRACWSCPIKGHDGKVMGTFALYFESPCTPNALHKQLVNACLHLTTIAMERESSKQRIRQLAYYDTLTHLPNRTMFSECAEQTMHAGHNPSGLLFFLDLDRFKLWNDSLGHAGGDALLCEIAERLGRHTRPEDVVGRLSSDEFAVLMPHCPAQQIPELAQRMLDAIAEPFSIHGVMTIPNACIGVCTYPEDGTDVGTLLRHADQAMYAAKNQGCQQWERYRPEMGQVSQERADMERELRQTLKEGGLQLHYQPQILSQDPHKLYGVEALARWQHPGWGWVAPPRFIAVAEDAGLIHQFTAWLMDAACRQLATWRSQGMVIDHVAINLSTNNFHDPDFAQHVLQTLQTYGLGSHDLVMEITESLMLDSSPATINNLRALHTMGIRMSMDDFGTGYSSLSYLHRLPISELKLDKSFVQDVASSSAASALTRSVLNIASTLNLVVVAEGVETAEQAQWLTEQGCPVLQGYLFAKPMPGADLAAWMLKQGCTQTA